MDEEAYTEAIAAFMDALKLVPEPKLDWEASTWIYASLADAYFLQANWGQAQEFLHQRKAKAASGWLVEIWL